MGLTRVNLGAVERTKAALWYGYALGLAIPNGSRRAVWPSLPSYLASWHMCRPPERMVTPLKARYVGTLVFAVSALFAGACSKAVDTPKMDFRLPVEVGQVGTGVVEDVVETSGLVKTREGVTIAIETPGRLQVGRDEDGERLHEGSVVRAGQVLARVLGEEARLHARVEATRRALYVAAAELRRQRELSQAKLVSKQALQQAEGVFQNALHDFRVKSLHAAKATLATPIDGTILHLAREQNGMALADGQRVRPGFVVAVVAPTDRLIVEVQLVGPELRRVRPGLTARIRHYAFPEVILIGKVERLLPEVDTYRQTVRAEVGFANESNVLQPGMFVEVVIVVDRREDVVLVPRAAVAERSGRKVVFVLDGQRVSKRTVQVGLGDNERVQVLAGLRVGDTIVKRGFMTLVDGARVRVLGT